MMFTEDQHTFAVCAYKENPFLDDAVCSLLNQTARSNIIISTSTPNDLIQSVARKYNLPLFINPNPHRAGDDWNYALRSATTPLVTVAHQDDIYEQDFLIRVLETINKRHDDDFLMTFTDYYEIRSEGNEWSNSLLNLKRLMNMPFKYDFANGSKFIKRRVLSLGNPICCPAVTLNVPKTGLDVFDTEMINSCDYKTWVDLANAEGRFIFIPEALMGHRIYSGSATTANITSSIRKKEDAEIFASLWPAPIASIVNHLYAKSEKSNNID